MNIKKTDDIQRELLHMTRDIVQSQEINMKISGCINKRLTVPVDNEELLSASEKISGILHTPARRILPLLIISRAIGIDGRSMPDFLIRMLPYMTVYKAREIMEDPYYKKISPAASAAGRFSLEDTVIKKGELFLDREPASEGYKRINRIGIFDDDDLHYPGFYEDGRCWMSITPNETATMKDSIKEASGRVLTLGLGLGYYAYMVHLKDDVESVTIIEREAEVTDIFEKSILPQFDMPQKVHIIRADAFDYMEKLEDGSFDCCFADIWQNPADGLEDYLRVKHLGNTFSRMRCSYWIEESFVGYLESYLATLLQFCYTGEDDAGMLKSPGYALMKRMMADTDIVTAEDVKHMFGGQYVRELLSRL